MSRGEGKDREVSLTLGAACPSLFFGGLVSSSNEAKQVHRAFNDLAELERETVGLGLTQKGRGPGKHPPPPPTPLSARRPDRLYVGREDTGE